MTSSHKAFEVQNLQFSNQQNPTFETMQSWKYFKVIKISHHNYSLQKYQFLRR